MDMEAQVVEALREELRRQGQEGRLTLGEREGGGPVTVEGELDLEPLAMAAVGAVAGGP